MDDEENIGRSLRMILEREGYAVNVCRLGGGVPAPSRAQPRRRVLLDVRLPDGSGIDLLRALQQNGTRVAGDHDLRPRHHRRCGGSHARRRVRFPRKAARPRPGAAGLKNALEHSNLRQENERLRELVGGGPK